MGNCCKSNIETKMLEIQEPDILFASCIINSSTDKNIIGYAFFK